MESKGVSGFTILIVIFVIILIVSVLSSLLVGMNIMDILQGMYIQIGLWLVLIGFGVFLTIVGVTAVKLTKRTLPLIVAKIGMAMITLSLLIVIVSLVLPLFFNKTINFQECEQLVDPKNVYKTTACVFVGYAPTPEASMVTYLNFIITAIICPFAFFYYIFKDLIGTMNFPSDKNAQNVIAFVGAYSALRGALASYFVEFFTYGWFGMGALAFGVFMMMMAWALIRKYFEAIILTDTMKKIFMVLSGGDVVTPKELIDLIVGSGLPYTFLGSHFPEVESTLNKLGFQSLANQIRAKYLEAQQKFSKMSDRNSYLSKELKKLV
jgi:hypothetical protein